MTITDKKLIREIKRTDGVGGVQRIYRISKEFGLSLVDSPMLHSFPFAWEAAVITNVTNDGKFESLSYDTPLTEDVEVFSTVEKANDFIDRAIIWGRDRDASALTQS